MSVRQREETKLQPATVSLLEDEKADRRRGVHTRDDKRLSARLADESLQLYDGDWLADSAHGRRGCGPPLRDRPQVIGR